MPTKAASPTRVNKRCLFVCPMARMRLLVTVAWTSRNGIQISTGWGELLDLASGETPGWASRMSSGSLTLENLEKGLCIICPP